MSEAWIAFTGVIVGSVISAGFTWFIEWRKSKSEEKIYLKRKQEEAYIYILNIVLKLNKPTSINGKFLDFTDFHNELVSYFPFIKLYFPKDINCEFETMIYSASKQGEEILRKLPDLIKRQLNFPLN